MLSERELDKEKYTWYRSVRIIITSDNLVCVHYCRHLNRVMDDGIDEQRSWGYFNSYTDATDSARKWMKEGIITGCMSGLQYIQHVKKYLQDRIDNAS